MLKKIKPDIRTSVPYIKINILTVEITSVWVKVINVGVTALDIPNALRNEVNNCMGMAW